MTFDEVYMSAVALLIDIIYKIIDDISLIWITCTIILPKCLIPFNSYHNKKSSGSHNHPQKSNWIRRMEFGNDKRPMLLWFRRAPLELVCIYSDILTGPLFAKQKYVLPPNLVAKSASLVAARVLVMMTITPLKLTEISAAMLRRRLSNCERLEKCKPESHGFETSWDLAARRVTGWWMEARSL